METWQRHGLHFSCFVSRKSDSLSQNIQGETLDLERKGPSSTWSYDVLCLRRLNGKSLNLYISDHICIKPSWNWPSISRFGRMNVGNRAQRLNAFCNTIQVMVLWYSSCFLRRSSSAFFLSSSFFLFSSSFFSFCSSSKYKERFFGHQCFAAANWHAERVLPHLSWTSYRSKHMLTDINQLQ